MRIVERFILRQFALAYGLISIMLLGLFGFFDLNTQLGDVGKGVYSTGDAVLYTLLGLPQRVIDVMPFTTLLATIATLGLIAQRRELVILRGAGISALRIAGMLSKAAFVLLIANIVLQTTIAPQLDQRANRMRSSAIAGQQADSSNGVWLRSRRGIIHIGGLRNGRIPVDVEFFRFAGMHSLARYIQAANADIVSSHDWQLHDIVTKRFGSRDNRSARRATMRWDPALYPGQINIIEQSPGALSPQALYRYIGYLKKQQRNTRPFQVALWQKLVVPFTTLAMMLFAIPLTFTNPRGTNFGVRLVIGGLIGLGVYSSGQVTANLSLLLALDPAFLMPAPPIAFILIALLWLRTLS